MGVELTLCKGCKLPYDVATNPDGCPRCKRNPELARVAQVNLERANAERTIHLAPHTARVLRIGLIALGGIGSIVITAIIVTSQGSQHTTELAAGRRHFAETACAMSGVDPATPAMEECVVTVSNDCKEQSMKELPECAQAAAQKRYAPVPY